MDHHDRRDFLRASIAAVAAGGKIDALLTFADVEARPFGVQLYTVRDAMERDTAKTLARVAEIGYKEVEFAGYFRHAPAELRRWLDGAGLSAPSAHVGMEEVRTKWQQTLDDAARVGHRYLVVAWIDKAERTARGLQKVAEEMNTAAATAKASGITVGYHNHDFEFTPLPDGQHPYDILLKHWDPTLIALQLDLFWASKAKVDPLAFFARHPGRIHSVHVKDMSVTGEMVDVGDGTLPFATYFAQGATAGIRHYFVEHDEPKDPFASIARSLAHLKTLTF